MPPVSDPPGAVPDGLGRCGLEVNCTEDNEVWQRQPTQETLTVHFANQPRTFGINTTLPIGIKVPLGTALSSATAEDRAGLGSIQMRLAIARSGYTRLSPIIEGSNRNAALAQAVLGHNHEHHERHLQEADFSCCNAVGHEAVGRVEKTRVYSAGS